MKLEKDQENLFMIPDEIVDNFFRLHLTSRLTDVVTFG